MSLKDNVFQELIRADGSYCSGGTLAKQFGVSRTAIWKVIEQLKAEGCEIQAVTNRGYLLTNMPDIFSESAFYSYMADCRTNWHVHYLKETDSTNNYAKQLAAQDAPEGTVVIADKQSAGKGRLGKHFHSPSGGLYMSVVLRPSLPLTDMMAVTACTASAVHMALQEFGITTQIKWVNDLFLNGRKICGILSEGSFNAELLKMDYLVIGIGVNLRPDPSLPEELKPIITDLFTESGAAVSRTALSSAILRHLECYICDIQKRTYLPIYSENSCTIGHQVQVKAERGECTALAVGFADDAGLIVEHPDGARETIRTGTAVIVD